jgi:hypothetical protein
MITNLAEKKEFITNYSKNGQYYVVGAHVKPRDLCKIEESFIAAIRISING